MKIQKFKKIKRSVSMTPNIGLPAADSQLLYNVGDAAIPRPAFPFPKTTDVVSVTPKDTTQQCLVLF